MTISLSATRKREQKDALQSARVPELRVLRKLPPTRYCAYAGVLPPQLVARCECWGCWERKQALSRSTIRPRPSIEIRLGAIDNMTPALREIDAEIARMIDEIEAADLSASLIGEVSDAE